MTRVGPRRVRIGPTTLRPARPDRGGLKLLPGPRTKMMIPTRQSVRARQARSTHVLSRGGRGVPSTLPAAMCWRLGCEMAVRARQVRGANVSKRSLALSTRCSAERYTSEIRGHPLCPPGYESRQPTFGPATKQPHCGGLCDVSSATAAAGHVGPPWVLNNVIMKRRIGTR